MSINNPKVRREINPWIVSDFNAFIYFNCPECRFQSKTSSELMLHAMSEHMAKFKKGYNDGFYKTTVYFCDFCLEYRLKEYLCDNLPGCELKKAKPIDLKKIEDEKFMAKLRRFKNELKPHALAKVPTNAQAKTLQEKYNSEQEEIKSEKFDKTVSLLEFMKETQRLEQPQICGICEMSFETSNDLRLHKKVKHFIYTDDKPESFVTDELSDGVEEVVLQTNETLESDVPDESNEEFLLPTNDQPDSLSSIVDELMKDDTVSQTNDQPRQAEPAKKSQEKNVQDLKEFANREALRLLQSGSQPQESENVPGKSFKFSSGASSSDIKEAYRQMRETERSKALLGTPINNETQETYLKSRQNKNVTDSLGDQDKQTNKSKGRFVVYNEAQQAYLKSQNIKHVTPALQKHLESFQEVNFKVEEPEQLVINQSVKVEEQEQLMVKQTETIKPGVQISKSKKQIIDQQDESVVTDEFSAQPQEYAKINETYRKYRQIHPNPPLTLLADEDNDQAVTHLTPEVNVPEPVNVVVLEHDGKNIDESYQGENVNDPDWVPDAQENRHLTSQSQTQITKRLVPTALEIYNESLKVSKDLKASKDNFKEIPKEAVPSCEFCDKQFKTWSGLLKHKVTYHNHKVDFKCQLCEFTANYPKDLRLHREEVHRTFKVTVPAPGNSSKTVTRTRYRCEFCDFSASVTPSGKMLMHQHQVLSHFKCNYCDFQGDNQEQLNIHQKDQHNVDDPIFKSELRKNFEKSLQSVDSEPVVTAVVTDELSERVEASFTLIPNEGKVVLQTNDQSDNPDESVSLPVDSKIEVVDNLESESIDISNETQETVKKELIESTDSQATFLLSWNDAKKVQAAKVSKTKSLEDIVRETITNPSSKENLIATTEEMLKQNQNKANDEREALRQIQSIQAKKRIAVERKRKLETMEWLQKLDHKKLKQCEFCDESYFTYQTLLKHGIARHNLVSDISIIHDPHVNLKGQCTFEDKEKFLEVEGKACEEWLRLTDHIERPIPQAEYYWKCKICNAKSESKEDILCMEDKVEHLKNHFRNKYCEICNMEFNYYNTLITHMNDLHEIYFSIPCELCSFSTSNYHKLKEHMADEHSQQAGQFPLALSSSENNEHGYSASPFVERLWKTQIEDKRRAYQVLDYRCFICNLDFLTKKHASAHFLWVHQKTTIRNKMKKTTCRLCETKFTSPSQCLDHMKEEHEVEMQFTCEDCFVVFPKHSELIEHRFESHGKGPKHKCQYCSLRMYRQEHLLNHEQKCKKEWKYEEHFKEKTNLKRRREEWIAKTLADAGLPNMEKKRKRPYVTDEKMVDKVLSHISQNQEPKGKYQKLISELQQSKTEIENIQCYICGQDKLLKSKLEEHVQTHHPEILPYYTKSIGVFGQARIDEVQCEQCKQVCKTMKDKNLHECGKPNPQWLGISLDTDSEYKCEVCGDKIANYHHYLWHLALFHDENKLKYVGEHHLPDYMKGQVKECKKCEFSSEDYNAFKRHMRNNHSPKVRCKYCDKLVTRHQMASHVKSKHENNMVTCDKCGKKLSSDKRLKEHLLLVHDHADFQCEQCGKKLMTKSGYNRHLLEHDNPKEVFKCTRCNFAFRDKGGLAKHMKKHQIIFICSICEDVFTAKDNLHAHLNEKHSINAEENPYPCPLCRAPNAYLKQLNDHIFVEHKVPKEHQCQTCDKLFTTKAILTMHMMEQHEFDAEADSMSKNISISAALKLAEVQVHEDEFEAARKIKCRECGAMVKSQRVLEGHMRQKHQPWTHNLFCHLCPWSTYEKYKMKKHMEEKHEITTFYCDQCDYSTKRRAQLSKHKRTVHMNIKSAKCPDCEESFSCKGTLKKHMWEQHKKVYKFKARIRSIKRQ